MRPMFDSGSFQTLNATDQLLLLPALTANEAAVRSCVALCSFLPLGYFIWCAVNPHMQTMPNDPSSVPRPAGRVDCNRSAMAGFAVEHV